MLKLRQVYPTKEHWEESSKVGEHLCTPEKFLAHYDVSLKELAAISKAPYSSVRHWFANNNRKPTEAQLLRITMVFDRWQELDNNIRRQRWK